MATPIRNWLRSSPLGSGSFASVSLAVDHGCIFAVKSTDCSSPSPSPELLAIENELDILQSLDSPTILRCFGSDFSSENGFSARNLFLEYMPGGSLSDLLKKSQGRLGERRVRLYTRQILEGLHYLHEQGIVHCDIKGQNILVGSSGVKIADFGAAKRLTCFQEAGSEPGSFRGTPLWMAPEVVQGVEQGLPSDVWSLGGTVVEMLQGRPLWSNTTNLAALLYEIGCSEQDPPLPESVSTEAKDFLHKCLQRDPKSRWTTAQLLEHPFVNPAKGELDSCSYGDQLSPRSIFDFCSESDEEEAMDSVPILSLPRQVGEGSFRARATESISSRATGSPRASGCAARAPSWDASVPEAGEWITVRRAEGWSEDRQKPFMESLDGKVVAVREVNLECAAFLRSRRSAE